MTTWLIISIVIVFGTFPTADALSRSYIAAAYDHARFGRMDHPPDLVVETNLKKYIKAGEIAGSKGADIIVYPEYGVFYPGNRTQLKHFLEDIPDPKTSSVTPCDQNDLYMQKPILRTLSCIAKNNSMYVVANTGDIKNCSGTSDCPEDGVFHFNTNVVFDRNGTLILKYYKEYLFFELGMDLAREQQVSVFTTDFGTFATYICFDMLFKRMGEVARWPQVDGVMFTAMWVENPPLGSSVQYWQGWALGNNATLVSSNIQSPSLFALGSGIFHKKYGALGYTYNPDRISKVVVAKVPVSHHKVPLSESTSTVIAFTDSKVWDMKRDGEDVSKICSTLLIDNIDHHSGKHYCLDEKTVNYTLVKLTQSRGYVEACDSGMCCSVRYSAQSMEEDFYLGVYNQTHNAFNRYQWCEENCFLARCDTVSGKRCSTFPRESNTVFNQLEMKSNFTTEFIYPSVVSNNNRLVPMTEWEFGVMNRSGDHEGSINFHSKLGRNLLSVGFRARCYERDPPYVR